MRSQRQHLGLSEWLLEEFALHKPGGPVLVQLDKKSGRYSSISPSRYMVELDAHPAAVESELGKHEGRGKFALIKLRDQMAKLPPGVYQLMKSDRHGEEFEFQKGPPKGYVAGMGLLTSGVLNISDDRTIANIARFLALTHMRSPRMRRYAREYRQRVEVGIRRELRRKGLPAPDDLPEMVARDDSVGATALRLMATSEERLISMHWWAIKTEPNDPMIIGDEPVVALTALGHAVKRLHLFEPSALVIAMPLTPTLAAVATTSPALTLSGPMAEFGQMVNASVWAWADRHVFSSSQGHLLEVEAKLTGPRNIEDPPPANAARVGRSLARRHLIPALRVKHGKASQRERRRIERMIGRKLPSNEIMAVSAKRKHKVAEA